MIIGFKRNSTEDDQVCWRAQVVGRGSWIVNVVDTSVLCLPTKVCLLVVTPNIDLYRSQLPVTVSFSD